MQATTTTPRPERWRNRFAGYRQRVAPPRLVVEGRLTRIVGLTLEAVGCRVAVGGRCFVDRPGDNPIEAEVVGFSGDRIFLMPTDSIHGLTPNARVVPIEHVSGIKVGPGLLGRVLDGEGRPLDGKGPLDTDTEVPLTGRPINPLDRARITQPLDVGVQAINALTTVGRGQRMGLFAGSGVGKSVLLGMMTRFTNADVIVVGLIGERGREVKEFIENILGDQGMKRAVVVASPSDDPPLLKIHGAWLATAIAEYFRDQGKQVLLLMDSVTRFAQAQRELALAIGEPPATKGYPPSVFAKLPQLIERAGNGTTGGGSITAFYTVLSEGDEQNDPVADAARAILDGHLVLSRQLADAGHYPAIDIEASISRAMTEITSQPHQQAAQQFKRIYSAYEQNRDLIAIGAYSSGADPRVDEAVLFHPLFEKFLRQGMNQSVRLETSLQQLQQLMTQKPAPVKEQGAVEL